MISTSSYHRQSFALKLWYIPTPNWSLCTAHLDCIHSPPHLALRALHSMSPLHIHNHLLVNTVCTVITPAINAHIWWGNDHIWWDKVHTLYTYLINVVLLHACTTSFMLQCSELPNTGIKNKINKKKCAPGFTCPRLHASSDLRTSDLRLFFCSIGVFPLPLLAKLSTQRFIPIGFCVLYSYFIVLFWFIDPYNASPWVIAQHRVAYICLHRGVFHSVNHLSPCPIQFAFCRIF